MFKAIVLVIIISCLAGCQVDLVPKQIEQFHEAAQRDYKILQPLLKQGDLIFRLGNTPLAGGLLDFSDAVADLSDSRFSHCCMVVESGDILIVDVTAYGIERRYFRDWHITGSKNIVVRRLKPAYQFLIPEILATMNKLIESDILYDKKFVEGDDKYYCTELVDFVFRINSYPMANKIRIKDMPNYNWVYGMLATIGGIDVEAKAVVAGNEYLGLFSSHMLETVIDMRGD